ncbi:MAG: SRPBCC domain-containing protein [Chitinophagales bacterium]|nr:SRPBCC domain-containing protein [Chitinophagales bacterium]
MAKENSIQDNQLFISRVIHAPRELVFKMWTDPEHMPKWWGPNGFTNTIHAMEHGTGGFCDYTMHDPDGKDWPNYQRYREVIPNEKIEYMHGSTVDDVEKGFHVVVNFEDIEGATRISMLMTFESAEDKQHKTEGGAKNGLTQHMNNMEDYITFLDTDGVFTISREFNAPIQLLYEVHTQKEHIMHFWGPKESDTEIIEFDLNTGGRIFYCMHMPDGKYYAQQIFREIVTNKLLTMMTTFCNEQGAAIHPPMMETLPMNMLTSMGFEAVDEHTTRLTIKVVPFNATTDEHQAFVQLKDSMHEGYTGTLDVLEQYLKTIN